MPIQYGGGLRDPGAVRDALEAGAERVIVGTAARHYELGQVALAVIKRSVPDDATLRVGLSTAAIEPATDAGGI